MSVRIARTLASLMYVGSPDRWLLDELNLLDVLARGLAIQRELAADNLDDLGMAALGELFGGLAGGKAGTIEYGALNELVLLQVGDRLLDGALVDVGLADDDGGVEVMGHAAKLLDLGSCQCHGFSLSMLWGAPRWGLNLRELSHDSAGTARCGACLPSSKRMRMPSGRTARVTGGRVRRPKAVYGRPEETGSHAINAQRTMRTWSSM